MKHDELQEDLAAHLRGNTDRMVWTNMQLGPAASPRPDVFAMAKSYANFQADAYEVKVTPSDLRHDVTSGKWTKYTAYAHRVWFAIPRGLVALDQIPPECGVIVRGETGWRAARKPIARHLETLPRDAWLKLVIGSGTFAATLPKVRDASLWNPAVRQRLGQRVSDLMQLGDKAEAKLEQRRAQLERAGDDILREISDMHAQARAAVQRELVHLDDAQKRLAVTLGLDEDASAGDLTSAINGLRLALDSSNLERAIRDLQTIAGLKEELPESRGRGVWRARAAA